MKKKILVIDSANLYHSNKYDYISGKIDNIIDPFVNQILELVQSRFPDIVVLCNDEYKSKYREELTKEYKSKRIKEKKKYTKKEQEADKLVQVIKKNLKHFPKCFIYGGIKDVEADDIMGILYYDKKLADYDIEIVSQDKDLMTVINLADLFDWKKDKHKNLEDRLDFTKNQWLMYQAIMGDGVDSIKGIQGAGKGTAYKLVNKYKNIKTLLAKAEEDLQTEEVQKDRFVKRALERVLTKEGLDEFKLSYQLVKIMKDTSLLEPYQLKEYNKLVSDIINFKNCSKEDIISDELDDILFENQAYKSSELLKEIWEYLN